MSAVASSLDAVAGVSSIRYSAMSVFSLDRTLSFTCLCGGSGIYPKPVAGTAPNVFFAISPKTKV